MSIRYKYRERLDMSPAIAKEIREKYASGGVSQSQLAREYDKHQSTISRIISRDYWNYRGYY